VKSSPLALFSLFSSEQ